MEYPRAKFRSKPVPMFPGSKRGGDFLNADVHLSDWKNSLGDLFLWQWASPGRCVGNVICSYTHILWFFLICLDFRFTPFPSFFPSYDCATQVQRVLLAAALIKNDIFLSMSVCGGWGHGTSCSGRASQSMGTKEDVNSLLSLNDDCIPERRVQENSNKDLTSVLYDSAFLAALS